MTLFAFNEDSLLNKSFVRGVNIVLWVLIILICFVNEDVVKFPSWGFLVVAFVTGIATPICLEKAVEKTQFFEWDYTERKKKFRFITMYVMFCSTLWVFISIDAFSIYQALISDFDWITKLIPIILFFFFVFNLLNICSLFYPLFENNLKHAYKFQKKPDNWQDDGPEINDENEIFDDIL